PVRYLLDACLATFCLRADCLPQIPGIDPAPEANPPPAGPRSPAPDRKRFPASAKQNCRPECPGSGKRATAGSCSFSAPVENQATVSQILQCFFLTTPRQ